MTTRDRALLFALSASFVVELGFLAWAHQPSSALALARLYGWASWLACPFLALGLWYLVVRRWAPRTRLLGFVVALVALGGCLLLFDAMVLHVDAQGALVFLFLPAYQLAVITMALVLDVLLRLRARVTTRQRRISS
jgi:hypothetical protein